MAGNVSAPVLDTHVLLWWTLDPDMLSDRAREVCRETGRTGAIVSSISIWEIGIKIKRGKLDIGLDIEAYSRRLQQLSALSIVPVDSTTWVRNLELNWDHRDPADRTIVATAQLRGADLVTKDRAIHEFYDRTIW